MNKNDFEKLGQDWKRLNEEYDNLILKYLDNPDLKPEKEEMAEMKQMQKDLYELEVKLFESFDSKF